MNVLGFDTATPDTVVALAADGAEPLELRHAPAPGERPGHASQLLPLARALLDRAGVTFADVDRIGVGVGPGTFTGLRIGVATARALATAAKVPVFPVSSLAALAAGIGDAPLALPLIDARRGELFGALYESGGRLVAEPFAAKPERVAERAGRELAGALAVGDGSIRFRAVLEAAGIRVAPDDSGLHVVRAAHVCRLAAEVPPERPEAVLPTYIRDPDAEPSQ
jgi:tRNA threonylcarbamoyladenosine biosynthesis protein TsaB